MKEKIWRWIKKRVISLVVWAVWRFPYSDAGLNIMVWAVKNEPLSDREDR